MTCPPDQPFRRRPRWRAFDVLVAVLWALVVVAVAVRLLQISGTLPDF